ncbi:hypothetical protein M8J76_016465 [Diaphorina citri]|nr:hypothetical protein M8J76_016465 [Diaphorina citri]
MKAFQFSTVLVFATVSLVNCKVVNRAANEGSSIDNVNLTEPQKRPFYDLVTRVEQFVEGSIHTILEDFFSTNFTLQDHVPPMFTSPLQTFHNFTVDIEHMGDLIFKRQESIVHFIQCECPDEENKCNHILARKMAYPDVDTPVTANQEVKDTHTALPAVDIIKLIRHFQQHFANVMRTQRNVFEYAQCACPNKRECMRTKDTSTPRSYKEESHLRGDSNEENGTEMKQPNRGMETNKAEMENDKRSTRPVRSVNQAEVETNKRSTRNINEVGVGQDSKGFFGDFFSWFSNLLIAPISGLIYHGTYPNGTHFFNGTLPDGAHYTGGEFHNGNTNGYFISTLKNDSNGNYYSSSSSSSSNTFGRK